MNEVGKTVERPWGSYTLLAEGPGYWVKSITILPGKRLSLQTHEHRSEQWFLISGILIVERKNSVTDDSLVIDTPGMHIPTIHRKMLHRASTSIGCTFLEVAYGSPDENDITRIDDDHGRAN